MSDMRNGEALLPAATEIEGGLRRAPSLAGQVYEELLQDIVLGHLEDGEKLPSESVLCERFGVSRPVLREALQLLKNEQLLVTRQGSGSFIHKPQRIMLQAGASMNASDIIRGLEYRMGIEPEAAFRAAKRRNENDLSSINAAMLDFEATSDAHEVGVHQDFKFHLAISIASHNDMFVSSLWRIHRTIGHELIVLNLAAKKSAHRRQQVREEHRQILEAIRSGDGRKAADISRYHIEVGLNRIVELVKAQSATP